MTFVIITIENLFYEINLYSWKFIYPLPRSTQPEENHTMQLFWWNLEKKIQIFLFEIGTRLFSFFYLSLPKTICVCMLNCVWFFLTIDCSPPGSSEHGIAQVRILEWVAISFSRGSSPPSNRTCVSCIGRQILYHWTTREAWILKYHLINEIRSRKLAHWAEHHSLSAPA